MSVFGHPDPPKAASRALRRLGHAPVVPTAYANRGATVSSMESEAAAAARQGYDSGYGEGWARAAEEAAQRRREEAQRTARALSALSSALSAAEGAEVRMRAEIQAAVPKLAFALLEELFGREVTLASNPGREAVSRALALDEGAEPAVVRLNPADIEALEGLDVHRVLRVVADGAVEPGGAVVQIGPATLDAQLGPALARVRNVLLGPQQWTGDDGAP
jgi:flagellar assembly protein FliH